MAADGEEGGGGRVVCRCRELREQLEAADRRLAAAETEMERLRRLNAIADQYNDDLRRQLDALNAQLHDARRHRQHPMGTTKDPGPQEEEDEDEEEAKSFRDAATEYEDQQNCKEAQVDHVTPDGVYSTGFSHPDPQIQDPVASLEISETRNESMKSLMNEIKETSEAAVAQSNFIFDPRTGMYYDSQSGYYYDAEKSLYYEPYSGCYYYYNSQSQAYEFRSQVDYAKYSTLSHIIFNQGKNEAEGGQRAAATQPRKKTLRRKRKSEQLKVAFANDASSVNETDENRNKELKHFRKKHKAKITDKVSRPSVEPTNRQESSGDSPVTTATADDLGDDQALPRNGETGEERRRTSESESNCSGSESELEDGELSSSVTSDVGDYLSCTEDGMGLSQTGNAESNAGAFEEVLRCTPCLRIVVKNSDCLPVGKLYVVTCTSVASVGRDETLDHAILIPDPLISKMHCDIKYDEELKRYVVRDHATQCGTFVNGKRLSETKTMSDRCPLYNGDNIRLSGTTLDVHIHPGNNTCMDCEPGNFLPTTTHSEKMPSILDNSFLNKEEREAERRRQLKAIRKKYGLEKMNYETDVSSVDRNRKYQDRAAERRATHGSDNPHQKDDLPSSVFRPIASENKGHRLLSKMGWKDGQSLGKSEQGIKEPIQVSLRVDQSAGLGSDANASVSADDIVSIHSSQKWTKARQRYKKISSAESHNSGPKFTRESQSENVEVSNDSYLQRVT